MITLETVGNTIFILIKKSVFYKKGALTFLSAPFALGVKSLLNLITKEIPQKDLILPIVIYCVLFTMYAIVSIMDFYTGLKASKTEHIKENGTHKGYISSTKLWSSIWKFVGIMVISNTILGFTYVFLLLNTETLYNISLLVLSFFFLLVLFFDLHSVGENQERRYRKKPKIYIFIDKLSSAVEKGIINKINKIFK